MSAPARVAALEAELSAMRNSWSWRLTAPVRRMARRPPRLMRPARHRANAPELRTNLSLFRERFEDARRKLSQAALPAEVLAGRFLDIGCGTGNGVLAASSLGANMAVGIDADLGVFGDDYDPAEWPVLSRIFGADASRCLLIEADISQTRFAADSFDYALMLDSAEHVPEPARFIRYAYEVLRPGGYFILESCPLYYSPAGAHLWTYFPTAEFPWVHLWTDFEDRLTAHGVDAWSERQFHLLNRVTHDELIAAIREAGFTIQSERRGKATEERLTWLAQVRERMRPEYLKAEHLLFEDWIGVVALKPHE